MSLIQILRDEVYALFGALRFFTRIPVPSWVPHTAEGLTDAARYFPLVGVVVGVWGALVLMLAHSVFPLSVSIVLSMVATVLLTGAFHEDGLSDMADGLGGGWDPAIILAIMKDSRVGSYGVVTLVLTLLTKFLVLQTLPWVSLPWVLIAGHAVSRACAMTLLATMDYVRDAASSKAQPLVKRLNWAGWGWAVLLILPVLYGLPAEVSMAGLVGAGVGTLWVVRLLRRWLGGYTGDCLGGVQQVSELGFYLGALAALGA